MELLSLRPLHFTQYPHLSLHQHTTFHYSLNHRWTFHYSQSAKILFKIPLTPILWTCLSRKNVQKVCGTRRLELSCQVLDLKEILRVQVQTASFRTSQLRFLNTFLSNHLTLILHLLSFPSMLMHELVSGFLNLLKKNLIMHNMWLVEGLI